MTKPAYLVEGDLEQLFLQNACPGCPVQRINCNGEDVSITSIAKRVGSLGRLLHKRHSPLVVIFDREHRVESADAIERALRDALILEELQVPVLVGVADRDIENWILADFEVFAEAAGIDRDLIPRNYEGEKGKAVLKKHLGPGRGYVETIDGVSWLKSCRPSVMRGHSASFSKLADALEAISCWWLNQQHLGEGSS